MYFAGRMACWPRAKNQGNPIRSYRVSRPNQLCGGLEALMKKADRFTDFHRVSHVRKTEKRTLERGRLRVGQHQVESSTSSLGAKSFPVIVFGWPAACEPLAVNQRKVFLDTVPRSVRRVPRDAGEWGVFEPASIRSAWSKSLVVGIAQGSRELVEADERGATPKAPGRGPMLELAERRVAPVGTLSSSSAGAARLSAAGLSG